MAVRIAEEHYDEPLPVDPYESMDRMLDSFMRLLGVFVERILIPFIIVTGLIIAVEAASAFLSGRL
ncbi:MAG TPA: hypothetical protein VGK02_06130 [Candidatus Aquicultor sp.]|jgi:hypothetical protein